MAADTMAIQDWLDQPHVAKRVGARQFRAKLDGGRLVPAVSCLGCAARMFWLVAALTLHSFARMRIGARPHRLYRHSLGIECLEIDFLAGGNLKQGAAIRLHRHCPQGSSERWIGWRCQSAARFGGAVVLGKT